MSDDASLIPLHGDAGRAISARDFVAALGLHEGGPGGRPRVVATMIESIDGRATVAGRSVALGAPADRALLRELRTAADAILVGSATLAAERYAGLLDAEQRARRAAQGLAEHPVVATISRRLDLDPAAIPVLAEPETPVLVYSEAPGELPGAEVRVLGAGKLTLSAVLRDLSAAGARCVLCEGGPRLLRSMVAEACLDDLFLTVSPLLVAGEAPAILEGPELPGPPRLALNAVHRSGDHLFLHYAAAA